MHLKQAVVPLKLLDHIIHPSTFYMIFSLYGHANTQQFETVDGFRFEFQSV